MVQYSFFQHRISVGPAGLHHLVGLSRLHRGPVKEEITVTCLFRGHYALALVPLHTAVTDEGQELGRTLTYGGPVGLEVLGVLEKTYPCIPVIEVALGIFLTGFHHQIKILVDSEELVLVADELFLGVAGGLLFLRPFILLYLPPLFPEPLPHPGEELLGEKDHGCQSYQDQEDDDDAIKHDNQFHMANGLL